MNRFVGIRDCYLVWKSRWILIHFNPFSPCSYEYFTVGFTFETSGSDYLAMYSHIPKTSNLQLHSCQNLKTSTVLLSFQLQTVMNFIRRENNKIVLALICHTLIFFFLRLYTLDDTELQCELTWTSFSSLGRLLFYGNLYETVVC